MADIKYSDLTTDEQALLSQIADLDAFPGGTFNLRRNGQGAIRQNIGSIEIRQKSDKPGIDIYVPAGIKNESVHIPVILSESGLSDMVYNDFYIGEDADVTIVAGCGIHNCGSDESRHDGIHTFHVGKNARMRYTEKHYGSGNGSGGRVLNPVTIVNQEAGSFTEMEMVQIAGVTSTLRTTEAHLQAGAKMVITERLLTDGDQMATSDMDIFMDGPDASAQIVSRSVGQGNSVQVFHPNAIGNASCHAHIQCDSIIMDSAKISSIPAISANHPDAQIIHEAAIGRINNDQLLKLESFGLDAEEAEAVIIEGFLK